MSKLQNKLEKVDIILIIVILILIVVNLSIYWIEIGEPKYLIQQSASPSTTKVETKKKEETKTIEIPQTQEEIIKKLATLGERDRMEYYVGQYFKHLEKKEYEEAYNMLYAEFKENYFPTLEDYTSYVQSFYPAKWALVYDDITRQGNIYVLKLKILDIFGSEEDEKQQRVVVKENNYNNFVISFQVIGNEEGGQNE